MRTSPRRRAAGADLVIVFPHWGVEYTTQVSAQQERLGHAAIDAGADMVIGNHPHWAGAVEIYKGKPIWYALGNFVFDQTWSEPTMEGITLELTFDGTRLVQVRMRPHLILDRAQPNFMDSAASGKVVMDQVFGASNELPGEARGHVTGHRARRGAIAVALRADRRLRFLQIGAIVPLMSNAAKPPDDQFEFEVAKTGEFKPYGLVLLGWFRIGSIRPGAHASVRRIPGRVTRLAGVGWLCGPGPRSGGPDGQLTFSDQDLAREVVPGDRIIGVSNAAPADDLPVFSLPTGRAETPPLGPRIR